MIVSNIIGGLGNQMFQYAVGRSVSIACGIPLGLHVSDFAGYGLHHGFQLENVFACEFPLATEQDVRKLLGWKARKSCRRLLMHREFAVLRGRTFVAEPGFDYWPGIAGLTGDCYLAGYWQSEKYFRNIESVIRSDFTFKLPLSGRNIEWAERIGCTTAVSLHVRRGDYASNPKTLASHGLCSADYYKSAVEIVARQVGNPEFFIFSDDIPWAIRNLDLSHPCHHIDGNQSADSHYDMQLMSLCRHHIVANSSFSWWGAWLNPRPDKIVVAPRRWFADGRAVKDLMPAEWVTL